WSLDDRDVLTLARWATLIEDHYSLVRDAETPMDIEWAKDGLSGDLYIVQARPETVHSGRATPRVHLYNLKAKAAARVKGLAIGDGVGVGQVRVIRDSSAMREF